MTQVPIICVFIALYCAITDRLYYLLYLVQNLVIELITPNGFNENRKPFFHLMET